MVPPNPQLFKQDEQDNNFDPEIFNIENVRVLQVPLKEGSTSPLVTLARTKTDEFFAFLETIDPQSACDILLHQEKTYYQSRLVSYMMTDSEGRERLIAFLSNMNDKDTIVKILKAETDKTAAFSVISQLAGHNPEYIANVLPKQLEDEDDFVQLLTEETVIIGTVFEDLYTPIQLQLIQQIQDETNFAKLLAYAHYPSIMLSRLIKEEAKNGGTPTIIKRVMNLNSSNSVEILLSDTKGRPPNNMVFALAKEHEVGWQGVATLAEKIQNPETLAVLLEKREATFDIIGNRLMSDDTVFERIFGAELITNNLEIPTQSLELLTRVPASDQRILLGKEANSGAPLPFALVNLPQIYIGIAKLRQQGSVENALMSIEDIIFEVLHDVKPTQEEYFDYIANLAILTRYYIKSKLNTPELLNFLPIRIRRMCKYNPLYATDPKETQLLQAYREKGQLKKSTIDKVAYQTHVLLVESPLPPEQPAPKIELDLSIGLDITAENEKRARQAVFNKYMDLAKLFGETTPEFKEADINPELIAKNAQVINVPKTPIHYASATKNSVQALALARHSRPLTEDEFVLLRGFLGGPYETFDDEEDHAANTPFSKARQVFPAHEFPMLRAFAPDEAPKPYLETEWVEFIAKLANMGHDILHEDTTYNAKETFDRLFEAGTVDPTEFYSKLEELKDDTYTQIYMALFYSFARFQNEVEVAKLMQSFFDSDESLTTLMSQPSTIPYEWIETFAESATVFYESINSRNITAIRAHAIDREAPEDQYMRFNFPWAGGGVLTDKHDTAIRAAAALPWDTQSTIITLEENMPGDVTLELGYVIVGRGKLNGKDIFIVTEPELAAYRDRGNDNLRIITDSLVNELEQKYDLPCVICTHTTNPNSENGNKYQPLADSDKLLREVDPGLIPDPTGYIDSTFLPPNQEVEVGSLSKETPTQTKSDVPTRVLSRFYIKGRK